MKSEQNLALSRRAFVGAAATVGAATALTAASPLDAYAVTAAEKKAQAAEALNKLKSMQGKLSAASDDFVNAEAEQQEAQAKMDEAQGRIDEASEQISGLQEQLGTRARSMYRSGSASFLDLLLGATSFQAFTNNWSILNNMNESDAEMVEQTKTLRAEVQEQKEVYTQQEAVAAENVEKAAAAKQEAEALVGEMQNTYNTLSAEAQQLFDEEQAAAARAAEERVSTNVGGGNNSGGNSEGGNSGGGNSGGGNSGGGNSGGGNSGGGGGSTSKAQSYNGAAAVAKARTQIGVPYVYGAGTPGVGWDCSHLVCWAIGIGYMTSGSFKGLPNAANPLPGDPVWSPGHVALYIGGGQMIEAPQPGQTVCIASVRGTVKRM